MNNQNIMKSKESNDSISEESINSFFQNDDVLMLSDDNINAVFNSFYKNFLDEAVYPHLTTVSKNQTQD